MTCVFSKHDAAVMRDAVFVREAAEDLSSLDLVLGEVDRLGWLGVSLVRCELAEGAQHEQLGVLGRR